MWRYILILSFLASPPGMAQRYGDLTSTELRSAFLVWKSLDPADQKKMNLKVSDRHGSEYEMDGSTIEAAHKKRFGDIQLPKSHYLPFRSVIQKVKWVEILRDLETYGYLSEKVSYPIIRDYPAKEAQKHFGRPNRGCNLSADLMHGGIVKEYELATIPKGRYKVRQVFIRKSKRPDLRNRVDHPIWEVQISARNGDPQSWGMVIHLSCVFPHRFFKDYVTRYGEFSYLLENEKNIQLKFK